MSKWVFLIKRFYQTLFKIKWFVPIYFMEFIFLNYISHIKLFGFNWLFVKHYFPLLKKWQKECHLISNQNFKTWKVVEMFPKCLKWLSWFLQKFTWQFKSFWRPISKSIKENQKKKRKVWRHADVTPSSTSTNASTPFSARILLPLIPRRNGN